MLAIPIPKGHYLYYFLGREAERVQRSYRPQGVLTVTEKTTRSLLAQLPCYSLSNFSLTNHIDISPAS